MNKIYSFIQVLGLLFISNLVHAQAIPIEPLEKGIFNSSAPTMTMYWQGVRSKALVLFIPGGEGHIGIKPDATDLRSQYSQMLKRLTNPALTSGKYDVVIFDSPYELSPRQPYPYARASSEHLTRIESVINYYKAKTNLPIWVIGHSNGGISLMELAKYLQKNNKTDLIAGMIVSGGRSETRFSPPMTYPILFMHHQNDACTHTLPSATYSTFEDVQKFSQADTAYVYIKTGQGEQNDPCRSGFHMYNGASEEVAQALDAFLSKHYP